MQEFTELCRKRDTAGAIAYSRKNLAPWATTHMPQLQQAMTMLVFGERTGVNLYKASHTSREAQMALMAFLDTVRPEPVGQGSRRVQRDIPGAVRPPVAASALARALGRTRFVALTCLFAPVTHHAFDAESGVSTNTPHTADRVPVQVRWPVRRRRPALPRVHDARRNRREPSRSVARP